MSDKEGKKENVYIQTHVFDRLEGEYYTYTYFFEGKKYEKVFRIDQVEGSKLTGVLHDSRTGEVKKDILDATKIYSKKYKKYFKESSDLEKHTVDTVARLKLDEKKE